MSTKADIQRNKLMHLENNLVRYGVYNAETLEKLIKTNTYITQQKIYVWEFICRTGNQGF